MENQNIQISMKAARLNSGYTQAALANKLGLSPKTISDWENKKVPIKPLYVYALAYTFGISDQLIRV
ncbi:helix-turn-helix domain-containing protein [Levilactobacillus cerevisiae]|uniref:helix-turn-helix domain-containing protein n=1 Tax=Levilactobacillus cerevisiae TaxID=1704076 RepID=UPI00345E9CCE